MRFGSPARFHRFALLAGVTLCLGCGDRSAAPSNAQPQKRSDPAVAKPAAGGDAAVAVGPRGTLKGTIVFDGDEIPPQTMVPIQTDPEICEKHGASGLYPMEDYVIDRQTRGIRHVVVYLKGEAIRKWAGTPSQNAVIDNRNCRFEPHVALATVGSTIEVKNSDDVYHTTHLYGPGGFQYNPGLRAKGESEQTELTRPGTYVVKCDRHGWMSAFLRVDDHPFHAVTDEQGRFEIAGIPPGTHQVEVFHEKFGERPLPNQVIEVNIEADKTATLDLKLSH
jgi:plastocyanin